MSRQTQFIGHTAAVADWLATCTKGEKIGEITGMFNEHVCDLHAYVDPEGIKWLEFKQLEIWSSGPMIFLGLKRADDHQLQMIWQRGFKRSSQEYDPILGQIYI